MKFQQFAQFLYKIETISSRNEITEALAEFLPLLQGAEIKQAQYLFMGRLAPQYQDIEFNVSSKLILKALSELYDLEQVAKLSKELGDVGLVGEELNSNDSSTLSLSEVFSKLYEITEASGSGSQEIKVNLIKDLQEQIEPLSSRYVLRVINGKLRLGVSAKTMLDALSWIVVGDKSIRKEIERAFGARADMGYISEVVLSAKDRDAVLSKLSEVTITPGVPVAAKLVEREKDSAATFERMGTCVVQPKLDGLRAQIHYDKNAGVTEVFSRNMESLTAMFPDLLRAVSELGVDSIILDSEAIGYDSENESYLSFQETIQRRRKHGVEEMAESIPVKAMTFDVLYLNGEDWTRKPLEERVNKLRELVDKTDKKVIDMLDSPTLDSVEKLEEYFVDRVSIGLEGVIVKKLGTHYDPGTRNYDWIKLKANTRSDLVDTVDVVVLGYFHGKGERAKYGFGSLLTGVYNPEDGKYYSVAKVGSGFTDENAPTVKADLDAREVSSQPEEVVVEKQLYPDVWVRPEIVIEVDADEITRSPAHTAARHLKASFEKDTHGKGLSLRFPRLKVWGRDKGAEQATTDEELLRMFELRRS